MPVVIVFDADISLVPAHAVDIGSEGLAATGDPV